MNGAIAREDLAPLVPALVVPAAAPAVRKRILHVFYRLQRGGAELRTLEALQALGTSSPVETHILIYSGEAGELDEAFRRAGATLHHMRLTARSLLLPFFQLLRRERIDAIHSHVQYFSGWLLLLASLAGVRKRMAHLWITTNPPTRSPLRALRRRLGRALLGRYATRVLAVSEDTLSVAFGTRDPRCRVIYGGIRAERFTMASLARMRRDARAELRIDGDALVVAHVGRFDPAKNHQRVIDIFAVIASRNAAAHLLIIGGGDATIERDVRAKVEELGLDERVTFTGVQSNVVPLVAGADVLLFPSKREGLPGAVLEALAVGTPCVASAIAGTREIAQFSTAIDLIDLSASDATWASRVEAAASDRSLRARFERALEFPATPFDGERAAAALADEWMTS